MGNRRLARNMMPVSIIHKFLRLFCDAFGHRWGWMECSVLDSEINLNGRTYNVPSDDCKHLVKVCSLCGFIPDEQIFDLLEEFEDEEESG